MWGITVSVVESREMNTSSYSYILLILLISVVISSLVLIHVQHNESSYKFVKHWKDEKRFMFPVSELPNIELIFPERNKIENAPTAFKIDQTPSAKMKKTSMLAQVFFFLAVYLFILKFSVKMKLENTFT